MPYYQVIANQGSVFDNATQFYNEMPKDMGLICRLVRGTIIEGKSVLRKVPIHDIKAQWVKSKADEQRQIGSHTHRH